MNDRTTADASAARSIQAYIDERPIWSDGTAVGMTPMTAMQWRILGLAAAGKFFEGFVVFMTGVALPLIAVAGDQIESIDLNPVIVTNNNDLVAVDTLIVRITPA